MRPNPSPRPSPLGRGGIDASDGCNRNKNERRQITQFEARNDYWRKAPLREGCVIERNHFFALRMELVIRLGPEVMRARRTMKTTNTKATAIRAKTRASKPFERCGAASG